MTLKQIFPFLLILAFILGVVFKSVSQYFTPFVSVFVMFSLYLGFLSMDISCFLKEIQNWKYHSYLAILRLILIPVFAFFIADIFIIFGHFDEQWKIGTLVLFGISSGVAAPSLIKVFGGNFERALINTLITSLCVSFTIPLLLAVLAHENIHISLLHLSISLGMMIGIPFLLALFSKYLPLKSKTFLKHYNSELNILSLILLLFSIGYTLKLSSISHSVLFEASILLILINIMNFFLGWHLAFDPIQSHKFTVGGLQVWTNNALSIVIATQFFADKYPLVVLFTILSEIPWMLSPLCIRYFLKWKNIHSEITN